MDSSTLIDQWEFHQLISSLDSINSHLFFEMRESKKKNKMTENLGKIFIDLSRKIASKYKIVDDFNREEIIFEGAYDACMHWHRFDIDKSYNALMYMTQIIKSGHAKYWCRESRASRAKESIDVTYSICDYNEDIIHI